MKKLIPLLLLTLLVVAACAKPAPTRPLDPAYRFRPGDTYELTFAERLRHDPQTQRMHVVEQATLARFDLRVIAVRADGAAHLLLTPTFGQVRRGAHGRPPITYEISAHRPRDPDDRSTGARYLRAFTAAALHVVVDAEGRWLRDFAGLEAPADFLSRDEWKKTEGLIVYPNDFYPGVPPTLLSVYIPGDWRRLPTWNQRGNLTVHPPMSGYIPIEWTTGITKREGTLLTLTGQAKQVGKAVTRPVLGIVAQGDRTLGLQFGTADFEARFNLEWGMPLESRVEYQWLSTRMVDGVGEVLSKDGQVLTAKLRRK